MKLGKLHPVVVELVDTIDCQSIAFKVCGFESRQ